MLQHRSWTRLALAIAFLLALTACSDDSGGSDEADATASDTAAQDTTTAPDTTPAEDTAVAQDTTPEDVAPIVCDRNGFNVAYQLAEGEAGFVDYVAASDTELPVDKLSLELLYENLPALPYGFSFHDENYNSCETCVTIRTDVGCEGSECVEKLFLVYSGELEVTTWDVPATGSRISGTLSNIIAGEVTLPGDGSFTSTAVEGGEFWCIDSMAFDTELAAW